MNPKVKDSTNSTVFLRDVAVWADNNGMVGAARGCRKAADEIEQLRDSVKAADDGREEWESACKSAEAENEWFRAVIERLKANFASMKALVEEAVELAEKRGEELEALKSEHSRLVRELSKPARQPPA